MKIDSSTPSPVNLSKTRQARPASSGPAAGAAAAAGSAPSLSHAPAADAAGAPIDSQRIAEISQAIADGRLHINTERIADRLIEGVREQLGKDRQP